MELLIGLIVLAVAGVGVVFWMLKNDTETDEAPADNYDTVSPNATVNSLSQPQQYTEPDAGLEQADQSGPLAKLTSFLSKKKKGSETQRAESRPPSGPISGLLDKLKGQGLKIGKFRLGKREPEETDSPEATHFTSLKNYFGKESQDSEIVGEQPKAAESIKINKPVYFPTGTASLTTSPTENRNNHSTPLSDQEEKSINREIELSAEISELKEKCAHLESMLKEKSVDLETAQAALDNELKNRKDFNKVKDILEKDLKDTKDKSRGIQVELSNAQSEGERYKKRITLLEEKVTRLEKDLLGKEDKIDELVKRLQTFASPSTSAVPPVKVEPAQTLDLKPSTSEQIAQEGAAPSARSPKVPDEPKYPQPPQRETPLKKDVFSVPEPRVEGLDVSPPATPIPEPDPAALQSLTEPEKEQGGPDIPEDIDYPEDSPSNGEPFLKLQPDVMSGTPQSDDPQQTAAPPPSSAPSSGPEKAPDPKPKVETRVFKIIDPDNLSDSE